MFQKLILLLCLGTVALAQKPAGDADRISFSHQYQYLGQDAFYFIDTSLSRLNWYHQLNNGQRDNFGELSLSNLGAARNSLIIPELRDFWTMQGFGPYQAYFTQQSQVPFYHVRSPLTDARYLSGYERGQLFSILHTQNINERWNFMLQYKRLNSLGFYDHQQNKQANFLFSTQYQSKSGVYQAKAYLVSEKLDLQENGGITEDSLFTENLQTARVLFTTPFSADQRLLYNRDMWLDQKIDFYRLFSKRKTTTDSIDSAIVEEEPDSKTQIVLGHQFRYQRQAQVYSGRTNNVYENYYYDLDGVYRDSMSVATYSNRVYLETELGDTSKFNLHTAAVHQYFSHHNFGHFDVSSQHLGLEAKLKGNYKDYFELQARGSYILSGAFANNFDLQGYAEGKLYKSFRGFIDYQIQNKLPDFYEQAYFGNNFIWNAALEPVLSNELRFGLRWQKENYLRLRTFTANNLTYFDSTASLTVAPDVVAYQTIDLVQNFDFWSWLHLDNQLSYQIALGGQEFLPLPEFVNRHSLYFEFDLFDGALKILTGVEGSYFSSFNSPSYMPATGRFYLANEYPIGDYWILDGFVHFKVSKAIFFLKMENLTEGITPYNYWAAPHYPLNDRVLRVGINWRFFN